MRTLFESKVICYVIVEKQLWSAHSEKVIQALLIYVSKDAEMPFQFSPSLGSAVGSASVS